MSAHPRIHLFHCIVFLSALGLHFASAATLRIFPEHIQIHPLAASQRVVVTLTDARGLTSDVTAEAKVTLENPSFARWQSGVLTPLASGTTRLAVNHAGLSATTELRVARGAEVAAPSFQNDVVPVLMRYGCSTGGATVPHGVRMASAFPSLVMTRMPTISASRASS